MYQIRTGFQNKKYVVKVINNNIQYITPLSKLQVLPSGKASKLMMLILDN